MMMCDGWNCQEIYVSSVVVADANTINCAHVYNFSRSLCSLLDYEWRTTAFRSAEADRLMDQSLARMQGKEQAPYLRPMDAAETKIGPLGKLERWTVEWLSGVIAEEGRRAKKIVSQDGKLVRPIEITGDDGEQQQLGPLGYLEKQVSDFLSSIRRSEQERVRTKTLQPSKLPDDMRGPLGNVELALSKFLAEVRAAETLRAEQSRRRGGEMVRPIDVPGPLGEWEMKVADILRAEERRAMELNNNEGRILRPKDARWQGPLGELEQSIFDFFDQLRTEENERLQSIRQLIQEKRPMDNDRSSLLGAAEAFVTSFSDASQRFVIGVVRAPRLIVSVFERVAELLNSESLPASDKEILRDADNKKSSSRE